LCGKEKNGEQSEVDIPFHIAVEEFRKQGIKIDVKNRYQILKEA